MLDYYSNDIATAAELAREDYPGDFDGPDPADLYDGRRDPVHDFELPVSAEDFLRGHGVSGAQRL